MKTEDLIKLIQQIVEQACELKNKHTWAKDASVNYVAVFSHGEDEYNSLLKRVEEMGYKKIAKDTPTGPLFQIDPIETVSGEIKLLKIRKPDPDRAEAGYADFTVADYDKFKKGYLGKNDRFRLIEREDYEIIELRDKDFDFRAYFAYPPLDEQLGI